MMWLISRGKTDEMLAKWETMFVCFLRVQTDDVVNFKGEKLKENGEFVLSVERRFVNKKSRVSGHIGVTVGMITKTCLGREMVPSCGFEMGTSNGQFFKPKHRTE